MAQLKAVAALTQLLSAGVSTDAQTPRCAWAMLATAGLYLVVQVRFATAYTCMLLSGGVQLAVRGGWQACVGVSVNTATRHPHTTDPSAVHRPPQAGTRCVARRLHPLLHLAGSLLWIPGRSKFACPVTCTAAQIRTCSADCILCFISLAVYCGYQVGASPTCTAAQVRKCSADCTHIR